MRTAISWTPPSTAEAHLSLRLAASSSEFDDLALRQLFRLINAHPKLVAHGRILGNISALLAEIATSSIGPLGPWASYLDQWIKIARWASVQAPKLSLLPGLGQFNDQPQHVTNHPLLGEGVERHGVVAALWNRHESCTQYPPAPENEPGWRYFRLQAHLLYSYISARWKWVLLEDYESHAGARERPAPALSGPASRAIREFSLNSYNQFLAEINPALPAPAFYQQLREAQGGDEVLLEDLQDRAESYLVILQRYFKAAWRIHNGKRPKSSNRTGGGGGLGSKDRIPGFISVEDTLLVLKRPPDKLTIDTDEDAWPPIGDLYWGPSGADEDIDSMAMEKSGLSPSEDLEPILELVDADQYAQKMHGAYFGHLAREMAAQSYLWDWSKISRGELCSLWASLENTIDAAYRNPSNKSKARYSQISALMLKFMLLYGQSCERACALRIQWVSPDDIFTESDPGVIEHPTLFVMGDGAQHSASDQVIGFGLPALSPVYKTSTDERLENISRQLADGLVLPDLSNLGQQLLSFHFSERKQDEQVFHIDLPTAGKMLKALLEPMDERITPARITRTLPAILIQQTGDESLAWLTFAMTEKQGEPRLHYTMASTERIRQAYANSVSTLLQGVNHTAKAFKPTVKSKDPVHVGCRFVLAFDPLKRLITDLKRRLTERYRNSSSLKYIMEYDSDYLFYTYLMLTISTCNRARINPVNLYREWQESGQTRVGMVSGQWDKETMFFDKSRLINVLPTLSKQFRHYLLHIEFLMGQLRLTGQWKSSDPQDQLLITFDDKYRAQPLTPTWIEERFEELMNAKVPCNFGRAFMRTELLERGVSAPIEY